MRVVFLGFATLFLVSAAAAAPHPDDPLRILATLPFADDGIPAQSSSYDRTGGNDDGFSGTYSVIREVTTPLGLEHVILEADRPGILGNIWFTGDIDRNPNRRIRFYFDGELLPRVDLPLATFFSGQQTPFLHPLVAPDSVSSGGFVNAMVLPWNKSLMVTTTQRQKFFHFTYRTFDRLPAGYQSFDPRGRANAHQARPDVLRSLRRPSRLLTDTGTRYEQQVTVPPGGSVVLAELTNPGIILRMDLAIETRDRDNLRRSLLKIYWDGEPGPSVEAPIGDFFGCPFGLTFFESVPFGSTVKGFYSNWPMPFSRSARLVVDNGSRFSPLTVRAAMAVQEDRMLVEGPNVLRFHAKWSRALTESGKPHTILVAQGRGHFVGVSLAMLGPDLHFLEGDEQIYVDGAEQPCIHGTGTEDYFNGGWYFNHGLFALPYHGLTVKEEKPGRIVAYRLHLPDLIPFRNDIRVQIEHGPANNVAGCDYASVAYWYQSEPHAETFVIPPAAQIELGRTRTVVPESGLPIDRFITQAKVDGPALVARPWQDADPDYVGGQQLFFPATRPGQSFTLRLPVRWRDRYVLTLGTSRGREYGCYEVLLNGRRLGFPVSASAPVFEPKQKVVLGPAVIEPGTAEVTFRTVHDPNYAPGTAIGLASVALVSSATPIMRWMVAGPFDLPSLEAIREPLLAEAPVEFGTPYPGKGGRTVKWQQVNTGKEQILDLGKLLGPNLDQCVALCLATFTSKETFSTSLLFGSDDAAVVSLNGQVVHTVIARRDCIPDQDVVPIQVHRGENVLLAKVGDIAHSWRVFARIADPDGYIVPTDGMEHRKMLR